MPSAILWQFTYMCSFAIVWSAPVCQVDFPQTGDLTYRLHLRRNSGCHDPGCQLCESNPNKKCTRQMGTKYMVRESLKSGCGVGLYIRLTHGQQHGSAASALQDASSELQVQVHVPTGASSMYSCC